VHSGSLQQIQLTMSRLEWQECQWKDSFMLDTFLSLNNQFQKTTLSLFIFIFLHFLRFKSLYQVNLKLTRNGWPSNDKLRRRFRVVRMSVRMTDKFHC
jgi:hypothetical protein